MFTPRAQGEPVKNFGHQQDALAPARIAKIRKKTRSMSGYLDAARAVWNLEWLDTASPRYGLEATGLRGRLGGKFFGLQQAMAGLRAVTFRSSSWVENLNSRLRNYFFLRGQIGSDYLELL
jgi:hypothetical protein